jgi:hypothetical protein
MLTDNTDVENQQANGTVGHLQTVKLKPEFGKDDIAIVKLQARKQQQDVRGGSHRHQLRGRVSDGAVARAGNLATH